MRVGLGDCVEVANDGSCLVDNPSVVYDMGGPTVTTGSNLCAGMSDAQCSAYLDAIGGAGIATTSIKAPPAAGPGSWLQPLTQAAASILSRTANTAPVWVTNPVTGQSVLYNPNTGQNIQPAGQGITNPTLQSFSSYIPLLLAGVVAIAVLGGRGR